MDEEKLDTGETSTEDLVEQFKYEVDRAFEAAWPRFEETINDFIDQTDIEIDRIEVKAAFWGAIVAKVVNTALEKLRQLCYVHLFSTVV